MIQPFPTIGALRKWKIKLTHRHLSDWNGRSLWAKYEYPVGCHVQEVQSLKYTNYHHEGGVHVWVRTPRRTGTVKLMSAKLCLCGCLGLNGQLRTFSLGIADTVAIWDYK